MKSIHPGLILAPLLLISSLAQAAEPVRDHWTFELTAGAGTAPRYSGSKQTQAVPVASFEATSPGGWFLGTSGFGWSGDVGDYATLRTYLGSSDSRRDKNATFGGSDHLRGMGNINTRALVGVGGTYAFGPTMLNGNWKYTPKDSKRGDNGLATHQVELSVMFPIAALAGGHLLGSVSTEYGDRNYMQTWYGVSARQAVNTGFKPHQPKAGFSSAGVGLNWVRPAGAQSQWLLSVDGRRLLGDAGDSPVVQQKTQVTMSAAWLRSF